MRRGKYIVLDGPNGSGKDSNLDALRELLQPESTIFTREPGGTPLAETIREMLLDERGRRMHPNTRFGLFTAGRSDLFQEVIIPSLERGINVISNRDRASTFAFQVRNDNRPELYQLFYHVHGIFCQGVIPDLYAYFDVDPKIAFERTLKRGNRDHFDEKGLEEIRVIREGYLEYFREVSSVHNKTKVKIIDANRPLDIVKEEFVRIILEELKS
ncbi:MAG: dTMP kinase [bacterium]|nr:dTMP kinase [bacterium]